MGFKKCFWLLVAISLILTGCIETKRTYVLNPDGSGKVDYYIKTLLDLPMQFGDQSSTPLDKKARRGAADILKKTEGIETWKDVSYSVSDDGKLVFKGTAYFKDFNALNLDTSTQSSNKLVFQPANEKGEATLTWKEDKPEGEEKAPPKKEKLPEAEIQAQIATQKAQFNEAMAILNATLGGFKEEEIFLLPGKIESSNGFKVEEKKASLKIDGADVLAAIKKMTEDENFWRNAVLTGSEPLKDDSKEFAKQIFGAELPFVAKISGAANQFDYAAEVAQAQAGYQEAMEKIGLYAKPAQLPADMAAYEKMSNVKVGGVELIYESDEERQIRPNSRDKGLTLYLIGDFAGPVDSVSEVTLDEATADDGSSLKKDEFNFNGFPDLSNDKTTAVFPVNLKLPEQNIKTIKKLAGTISVKVVGKVTPHDLGMLKIAKGTKSKELESEILEAKKDPDNPGWSLVKLKVGINSDLIASVNFFDNDKNPINYASSSSMSDGYETTYDFGFEGKLPQKATIVVETYENNQTFNSAWMLENIPVMGR